MTSADNYHQEIYEIVIQGELDESWQQWLSSLTVTHSGASEHSPVTILIAPVADQAALRGALCKLWDLNLTLISVRRVEGSDRLEYNDE